MFKIYNTLNESIDYNFFLFPAGEVGIKLACPNYKFFVNSAGKYKVVARLHNSNDIISLAMIKDAIEREDMNAEIDLVCPYIPYARQDRVCDKGEAFSLKVFTNLLNSLNFKSVTVCDPHSEVASALINNVKVVTQLDIIRKSIPLVERLRDCVLISPDAGSNKKTSHIAEYLCHKTFTRADKLRDLSNGKIKETIVYNEDFMGCDVACLDDIIDGGRTFTELAKVCKNKNCGKFVLYATHGIFSKGVEHLLANGIDEIWTTDSFTANLLGYLPESPEFNILSIC